MVAVLLLFCSQMRGLSWNDPPWYAKQTIGALFERPLPSG
jgi:hypothetical protein